MAKASLSIMLPLPLMTWVERRAQDRGFSTSSDFVCDVLLRLQQDAADMACIEEKLLEAIEGPPATPMTDGDWKRIREEGIKRATERREKFPMTDRDIEAAIAKAQAGIARYLEIMRMLPEVDVSRDAGFQKRFNGFYRMRQRSAEWYRTYFAFLQEMKGSKPGFDLVLDHLHEKLGRCEASFSSKLAATLNPDKPIWDRYILDHAGVAPIPPGSPRKLYLAKAAYRSIESFYVHFMKSEKAQRMIGMFNEKVREHAGITDVKKVDFVLWQMR